MDARKHWLLALVCAFSSLGASFRTPNFVVNAPSPQLAKEIGQAAEKYRRDLAIDWLGRAMPNWAEPCPITAHVAEQLGAGGATSFLFEHGEVYGWQMTIQGSRVRILDSVLPHEVTHTIFASHFRRPLPRWADEGACTTVEHPSEIAKQQRMLGDFLRTGRGIAFNQMFAMKEYPHDVLPLYSQGYSLASYLIAEGGRRKFLEYLSDGLRDENWNRATKKYYGYANLGSLQTTWLDWVKQGSPARDAAKSATLLASAELPALQQRTRPEPNLIYRGPATLADSAVAASAARQPRPEPVAWNPEHWQSASAASAQGDKWHSPGKAEERPAQLLPSPAEPAPVEVALSPRQAESDFASTAYQATRPQPPEPARQIILEWTRPPATATTIR